MRQSFDEVKGSICNTCPADGEVFAVPAEEANEARFVEF